MKTNQNTISARALRMRGFSLIEVMVALIIIAVGMLGIAKMQALALSTTESSGVRSLVAIEGASLAATMHANRDYWVAGPPPPVTNITVATTGPGTYSINIDVAALAASPTCGTSSACPTGSSQQIAAYDVQQWALALAQVVPAAKASIYCNNTGTPLNCTIQIVWQENVTSASNSTAATSSAANVLNSPVYTLYVEP